MEIRTYDLSLDIDFKALTYSGKVLISLDGATQDLALNSLGLNIRSVSISGKPVKWEEKPKAEELILHDVPSGTTRIDIEFDGRVMEGSLVGLYRSRFDGGYILTTMFCATQARRLFPCLDHPAYKAVFNVGITVDEGLRVIFNTPLEKETRGSNGKKVLKFHPTPRMSTYLVYVGVGKFFEVDRKEGKLLVTIALPEEKKGSGKYALDHAGKTVAFFERYFDVPYPLPKLHLISVPDAWFGGMENWGAIAFNESNLLADDRASALLKADIVGIIAHEIAHQWFGDLVTMAWWNDVWLNESFATFMSYKAVDALHPEWEVWNDFPSDNMTRAFLWDALRNTHAIEADVVNPEQINEAFDAISYEKGGSVLRMVETYVGEDAFRRGVSAYLKKFQYGNASGADLWIEIEKVAKIPVPRIMDKWIKKEGYPIVTARLKGSSLVLEQKRFLLTGKESVDLWPIPISLRVNGEMQHVLMEGERLSIDVGPRVKEVVLNVGRTGFYRVNYGPELMALLAKKFKDLSEPDRWGMIQDLYAFVMSGEATVDEYLKLVQQSDDETSRLVVGEIGVEIMTLFPILEGNEKARKTFQRFLSSQMDRIGRMPRPGEPDTVKSLREKLSRGLVSIDENYARELAKEFPRYESSPPELGGSICMAYAMCGGKEAHDELAHRFLNAVSATELHYLALGLTSFRQADLLKGTLEMIFKAETGMGKGIELLENAFVRCTFTPEGRSVMWPWFVENLDNFIKVTKGSALCTLMLQSYLPRGGLGKEEEVRQLMEVRVVPDGESGKRKGLELLTVYERLYRQTERSSAGRA
jgi:tricorn protease interacting factor F2/3